MRIKDKCQFAIGVFNMTMSIAFAIILVLHNRAERIPMLTLSFACGTIGILNGIETKAQRQKRKEELQAMAKMYGWYKDDE